MAKISLPVLLTFAATLPGLPAQESAQKAAPEGAGLERAFPRLRFDRPVGLTGAGDGSGRIFVVEQDGVVRVFEGGEDPATSRVFLDLRDRVSRRGNEEGLLGLAFAPDYAESGAFYVHYSSSVKDKVGVVSRFARDPQNASRALAGSEQVILEQPQPYRNHNGGAIAFGPDGMLYISFGDGGYRDDPQGNGQNLATWMGAVLRVDVSSPEAGYRVPDDNPFVGVEGAAPEVWACGLRNAWRMAFDSETGELWAADVGQNLWEEVNVLRAGGNYGWNAREATHAFAKGGELAANTELVEPVAEYGRELGISITGGAVYRGSRFPGLVGRYFFGDYVSGNLWSLSPSANGEYDMRLERRTGRSVAAFGEDDAGELYLLSFDGGVYRVVPSAEPADELADWPKLLSETGLFANVKGHEIAEGVWPYEVNVPFWSDGADKRRFFRLPAGGALGYTSDGTWDVPPGSTLVKSFSKPSSSGPRYMETRLIERTEAGWEAATYLWNAEQTDAVLAPEGRQFEQYSRAHGVSTWHAPSASECASCHIEASGYALGLSTQQLHRDGQLARWAEAGVLRGAESLEGAAAYPQPADGRASLETHVRAHLDVNCAMCHRPDGPGNAAIDLRFETPLGETGMIGGELTQGDLGVAGSMVVRPGEPERSGLWTRMASTGAGRMPTIASNVVDTEALGMIGDWIREMGSDWKPLFDGTSLAGWTQRNGTATYRVEDGAIVGRTSEGSPNSFLCTDREYGDFELMFDVAVDDELNSGVQIRSQTRDGETGRVNGPQVEIDVRGAKGSFSGYVYGEAFGGWMTPESERVLHRHLRSGEWNRYRIRAEGPRIQVWINGHQISDLVHAERFESHPKGFIGLQVHQIARGAGPFEVRWRRIRLREIGG